jgi:hypothetical protein
MAPRLAVAATDILAVGEERLGPPREAIRFNLANVAHLERLRRMIRRAAKAATWIVETP